MFRSHITIRITEEPSVVELEVAVPANARLKTSLDRILLRHEMRCLYLYVVRTDLRNILRAKIAHLWGKALDTSQLVPLLEDLGRRHGEDSSPRAA